MACGSRSRLVGATCLAVAVLMGWSHLAEAQSFELASGGRFKLCHAYERNLDSLGDVSRQTYEWPLNPNLKDFRKPRWRVVDPLQNIEVIKKMYLWRDSEHIGLAAATAANKWAQEEPKILDLVRQGLVRLETTRVDFDNDGHLDRVYRYFHPILFRGHTEDEPPEFFGWWYIYFNDRNPAVSNSFINYFSEGVYDSFYFKGRFYLIGWLVSPLVIFEPHAVSDGLAFEQVCAFDYTR
jgi:RNAse (barnase) inhibitor barstar